MIMSKASLDLHERWNFNVVADDEVVQKGFVPIHIVPMILLHVATLMTPSTAICIH